MIKSYMYGSSTISKNPEYDEGQGSVRYLENYDMMMMCNVSRADIKFLSDDGGSYGCLLFYGPISEYIGDEEVVRIAKEEMIKKKATKVEKLPLICSNPRSIKIV